MRSFLSAEGAWRGLSSQNLKYFVLLYILYQLSYFLTIFLRALIFLYQLLEIFSLTRKLLPNNFKWRKMYFITEQFEKVRKGFDDSVALGFHLRSRQPFCYMILSTVLTTSAGFMMNKGKSVQSIFILFIIVRSACVYFHWV